MSDLPPNSREKSTPIFDGLASEVGLIAAAVYGAIWRHCELKDGVCYASLETIGKKLGVDRATVMRNVKKLCDLGYLIDQTPGRRNATHTYTLGKSVAECNSSKSESVAESNTNGSTVAESNTPQVESVAECNSIPQTVAESYLKKKKEEYLKPIELKRREGESPPPVFGALTTAIAKICNFKIRYLQPEIGKELVRIGALFDEDNVTPVQVFEFEKWRKAHHWSGKSPPSLKQVGEFWGGYEEWVKQGRPDPPESKPSKNGQPANKSSPAELHSSLKDNPVFLQLYAEEQARNDKP